MGCGIRVFKKPRGYINVLKFLLGLSAAYTTLDFSTKLVFNIPCNAEIDKTVYVSVQHPYKMLKLEYSDKYWYNLKCENDEEWRLMMSIKLPFDYARTASLIATCAITSMSYSFVILIMSMIADPEAAKLKKVLIIDFVVTALTALAWLTLSSAWTQGALDLIHYLHPDTLFSFLSICIIAEEEAIPKCKIVKNASYDKLYASVVLGLANFLIWLCHVWFIYDEIISWQPPEGKTDPENNANSTEVEKCKDTKRSSNDADNNDHKDDAKGVLAAGAITVTAEYL